MEHIKLKYTHIMKKNTDTEDSIYIINIYWNTCEHFLTEIAATLIGKRVL
jgi:hypothetical protein